jgi:hypothetical protein
MKGSSLLVAIATVLLFSISLIPLAFAEHINYVMNRDPSDVLVMLGPESITVDGVSYPVAGTCADTYYMDTDCLVGVAGSNADLPALRAAGLDPDLDSVVTDFEVNVLNTNPNDYDTDNDGRPDGLEAVGWRDFEQLPTDEWIVTPTRAIGHPTDPDSDNDGLSDFQEWDVDRIFDGCRTDVFDKDTDGDLYADGYEVEEGNNPCNIQDHPTSGLVIPESPIGSIALMASIFGALGAFVAIKMKRGT